MYIQFNLPPPPQIPSNSHHLTSLLRMKPGEFSRYRRWLAARSVGRWGPIRERRMPTSFPFPTPTPSSPILVSLCLRVCVCVCECVCVWRGEKKFLLLHEGEEGRGIFLFWWNTDEMLFPRFFLSFSPLLLLLPLTLLSSPLLSLSLFLFLFVYGVLINLTSLTLNIQSY